ncbi:dUTPase [Paenibacillus odorifer]|uniref:dUTPase n=1 Tax=Paenibacillus odorifer TaxID=189426 RepID=UPI002116CC14|nr:dUTPase [Paenibacillus odorifer]
MRAQRIIDRPQAEIMADRKRKRTELLYKLRRGERRVSDRLAQIFEMQNALDDRIISERGVLKSLDEWVTGITIAMESEIDEIRREVNWKWWKNPKPVDVAALQGEVIDMWHFVVSLSEKVGLTADDVYRVYCDKNAENHSRQNGTSEKEGYLAKSSDEG